MLISSTGYITLGSARFSKKADASVTLPTLPKNIRTIITHLEIGARVLVMPVVIPTVPIAENVSNSTSPRLRF